MIQARPPDNENYIKSCRDPNDPKKTRWHFHGLFAVYKMIFKCNTYHTVRLKGDFKIITINLQIIPTDANLFKIFVKYSLES